MFIRDFSWTHEIGHRPEIELKISDVKETEILALRYLSANGDRIRIDSCSREDWVRSDVERTIKMFKTSFIKVEKVIFNKPATIVFWSDNTKTVVVCGKDDTYDKEKGFYIACAKKLFGNDYKAVGRMNKALEMAVVQTKEEKTNELG